jgi:hypothetical protein
MDDVDKTNRDGQMTPISMTLRRFIWISISTRKQTTRKTEQQISSKAEGWMLIGTREDRCGRHTAQG